MSQGTRVSEPARPSSVRQTVRSPRGYVQRVTRSSGSSFYYAFLTLPRPRREAIVAVYAFCHAVDNAVDEAPDRDAALAGIEFWRDEARRALGGTPVTPIGVRAGEVARQFSLPGELFFEVIEGVAMDVTPTRFRRYDELARYCDLVAGAVGRLCVRIFGRDDEDADRYAASLGAALQLTNILRDLGPDAALGRFYLPLEDLERFELSEDSVIRGSGPARRRLLEFEARRARELYRQAAEIGAGAGSVFCAAEVMRAIYARLLDRVVRADFPVSIPVVRVPRHEKLALAVRTWLRLRLVPTGRDASGLS